ncbi:hypothetical protein GOP47_0030437 [Adiantum capillus-veneris]|nr:hypothetical protein GOP47_0030071 [Adiantum capillus-veneris]KAI5055292.1 hypothetical protein GOP47_0030437 [Adiantum capillus-veneris]
MDNLVFVFGSFTEDEASHFQFSSESPTSKDRQGGTVSGSESSESEKKIWDGLNGSNKTKSAIIGTRNGDLKQGKGADLAIHLTSSESKEEEFTVSHNGGTTISTNKHHLGNGNLSNKEVMKTEALDRVDGNRDTSTVDHDLKHEELHVDSTAITPCAGTPCGTVDFNNESVVSPAKVISKTWAALLDDEAIGSPQVQDSKGDESINLKDNGPMQLTELSGDLWLQSLKGAEVDGNRLQPRGLVNNGNLCFLNATLQALLSCSPFVHLLRTLQARGVPAVGYPTLCACVEFFREFEFQQPHDRNAKVSFNAGKPFVPSMFDKILHQFNPNQPSTGVARSRQEDAQEFLTFTMDRFHDELLRLDGRKQTGNGTASEASEEDDWETVGPKNRTAVIRTHTFCKSALTDIFGGELCSVVKTKGSKASATVQPFLVLHLDILSEAVHTVEDALRLFAAPETLEGYRATAGKAAVVSASKSVKLQSLPRVLILHLKRFSYGAQGSSKLHKPLHFPLNLTLGRDLLSNVGSGAELRNYELVATVTHHGKDPSRGHYTAHSKQLNGQWLRYDDGVVSTVGVSRVLQDLVYLLFYKRSVNMR